jgi:transposase InsO family protein
MIHRVLIRHGLVEPVSRRRRREDYKRWQRDTPMQLWQMDLVGGLMLADGSECKIVTGVDDHSRYCVIAAVLPRATGRAVCEVFLAAMRVHGVPEEILTDNGKQFTGRFGRPRAGEVLFDRICRENGIEHLLTKPRSPTLVSFDQMLDAREVLRLALHRSPDRSGNSIRYRRVRRGPQAPKRGNRPSTPSRRTSAPAFTIGVGTLTLGGSHEVEFHRVGRN